MIHRILAPTDLFQRSDAGLRYGAKLARDRDAELHLIHVAESLRATGKELEVLPGDSSQDAETRRRAGLAAQAARTLGGLDATTGVLFGDPLYATLDYAEQHDIDLIVITLSNRSRSASCSWGVTPNRSCWPLRCPYSGSRVPMPTSSDSEPVISLPGVTART